MKQRLLRVYGRLPRGVRRRLIRVIAPSYTVGAACLITRDDGRLLLVRHSYRRRWGAPGGLLGRRELPDHAAVREVEEEVGLRVETVGPPHVVVEPHLRRVDIVFRARPVAGADCDAARPTSPEIISVEWFALDDLPELQDETVAMLATTGLAVGSGAAGQGRDRGA